MIVHEELPWHMLPFFWVAATSVESVYLLTCWYGCQGCGITIWRRPDINVPPERFIYATGPFIVEVGQTLDERIEEYKAITPRLKDEDDRSFYVRCLGVATKEMAAAKSSSMFEIEQALYPRIESSERIDEDLWQRIIALAIALGAEGFRKIDYREQQFRLVAKVGGQTIDFSSLTEHEASTSNEDHDEEPAATQLIRASGLKDLEVKHVRIAGGGGGSGANSVRV